MTVLRPVARQGEEQLHWEEIIFGRCRFHHPKGAIDYGWHSVTNNTHVDKYGRYGNERNRLSGEGRESLKGREVVMSTGAGEAG